jgi:NADPH:quinone reductase-like Zn-dependent oxidoreductase
MNDGQSKAVTFSEFGDPDVLQYVDVEEPHAGPGEVRVAVRAAAVNPIDFKVRRGFMERLFRTPLPSVPGSELAGVVDEVGEGVTDWEVGDEVVAWSKNGAYRDHAIATDVIRKPAGVSWEVAGGIGTVAETAARVLDLLDVKEGGTLLIHGAAGGVGSVAAQFAKARGVNVIGTASEGNHDYLRSIGVTPVTYGEGLVERVRAAAPDGVDWALDCAGKGALPDSIELTGSPEKVVTIADPAAMQLGAGFSRQPPNPSREPVEAALQAVEAGKLKVDIAQSFPFAQAADAHRLSEGGHARGKIVLTP